MKKTNSAWFVYLLECSDGRLYTGITTNLKERFRAHASGKGAKFTKRNPPSHMIAAQPCKNRSEACKLEWAIKQLKPIQKRSAASAWLLGEDLPKSQAKRD